MLKRQMYGRATFDLLRTRVSIPLDQAVETARLLESIVVSLDRIGSRMAGRDADAHMLDQFMTE